MGPTIATEAAIDFDSLLKRIHKLGADVVAPASHDVDAEARFPNEAFEALRAEKLLSAYVTEEFGGMGLTMTQIARICEVLGHYCASTAMVYAMHQIQVACILHHGQSSEYFRNYLRRIVDEQLLLASSTTELGVGGDLRSSLCCIETEGDTFTVERRLPSSPMASKRTPSS